jgi:hypothetical protein
MANILFNASLSNIDQVTQLLEVGQSTSFNGEKITKLADGSIKTESLKPASEYITQMNIFDVEQFITRQIGKWMPVVDNYTIRIISDGTITCRLTDENAIACLSKKEGSGYFDLRADTVDWTLNYSDKSRANVTHTGDNRDINVSKRLFHGINFMNAKVGLTGTLGACGYSKTPLHKFTSNNPIIMFFDHENKIINIIPCPIDKATVEYATLAFFIKWEVISKQSNKYLKVSIIKPQCVDNIDTTTFNRDSKQAVLRGLEFEVQDSTNAEVALTRESVQVHNTVSIITHDSDNSLLQFSDCLTFFPLSNCNNIHACAGFGNSNTVINIPFHYGQCNGHLSLLLGQSNTTSLTYDEIACKRVVHVTSSAKWNSVTANTNKYVGNGIFILDLK